MVRLGQQGPGVQQVVGWEKLVPFGGSAGVERGAELVSLLCTCCMEELVLVFASTGVVGVSHQTSLIHTSLYKLGGMEQADLEDW